MYLFQMFYSFIETLHHQLANHLPKMKQKTYFLRSTCSIQICCATNWVTRIAAIMASNNLSAKFDKVRQHRNIRLASEHFHLKRALVFAVENALNVGSQ